MARTPFWGHYYQWGIRAYVYKIECDIYASRRQALYAVRIGIQARKTCYMLQDGRPLRILLVEDSPTQAVRLQRILEERNFEVVLAGNGQQGLELFYQSQFDLVLSDVVMPEMNGFELCSRIKADPAASHVPVVLITSLCDETDRQRGLQSGADEYVSKPYDANGLLRRIASLIERLESNNGHESL